MKLAFTTLACPNWSWERIVSEASRLGYDGIELRGIEGELALHRARPLLPERIEETKRQLAEAGLEVCCLDTSCVFHDPGKFEAAVEEGSAAIDLAQQLGAPYIRVFGDVVPDGVSRETAVERVAEGLERLGQYAAGTGVEVLLETHGDFSASELVTAVLERVSAQAVGVLWDVNNPYKFAREPMSRTSEALGSRIRHTHIKDSTGYGKDETYRLPGEGDLPLAEALRELRRIGYDGWLSFEWEKMWIPSLPEPEVALPAYIRHMKSLLAQEESR